jgi:hypothetical protein
MSYNSIAVLLTHLDEIITLLDGFSYLKYDREVYAALHDIFHYVATGDELTISKKYVTDPRLQNFMNKTYSFLNYVWSRHKEYVASMDVIAKEMYKRALDILKNVGTSNNIHVFACDALSIVDALFIIYKLSTEYKLRPRFFSTMINPSGKTSTYKFLLDPKRFLEEGENVTLMNAVRNAISSILNTSIDITKFDDIDKFIHDNESISFNDVLTMINNLYGLVSSLYMKVKYLVTNNIVVFLVSDHGYDIQKISSEYRLRHGSGPNSLSILAPIFIIQNT